MPRKARVLVRNKCVPFLTIDYGLPEEIALELITLTLIVVTLSIIVHGVSVKPLMDRFQLHRKNSNSEDQSD